MDKSTKIKLAILILMFAAMALFGVGLKIYMNNEMEKQSGQAFNPYNIVTSKV